MEQSLESWCSGLFLSARWFVMASLAKKGVHIVVMPSAETAEYCASDLYNLIEGDRVFYMPSSGRNLEKSNYKSSLTVQRTSAIATLLSDNEDFLIIVTYPESLEEGIPSASSVKGSMLRISTGTEISHDELQQRLMDMSFERVDFVSAPGQYAVRGSIVDIFSYSDNNPYRVSFFGNEVEKISIFNCNTQLSSGQVDSIDIIPDLTGQGEDMLTDYLPADSV
ncbi:MAG: transcription-repair coupling factor, partial [Bacteroidales bacterium]|nr:transcription-repair coupling factor [Bacteroidales bacterium]